MANLKTQWTNAWESSLTAELAAGANTVTVGDASRLSTPCYLVIDPENDAAREYVLVTFISGNNLTVERYQADSAQLSGLTHAAGTIIRTSAVAQGFTDLHDRVDALGDHGVLTGKDDDDHPHYLNNTRHQADGAHPVGTVVKAGSPIAVVPGQTIAAGSELTVARSDHRHGLAAGTPGASAPGDVAAEGVATTVARSDHRHEREAEVPAVGFSAKAAGGYTLVSTLDAVPWNSTPEFDTDGFFDSGTPTRITVPAGLGGVYFCRFSLVVAGSQPADALGEAFVRQGGGTTRLYGRTFAVGGSDIGFDISGLISLDAGHYVEALIAMSQYNAGSNLNGIDDRLQIYRLGPRP